MFPNFNIGTVVGHQVRLTLHWDPTIHVAMNQASKESFIADQTFQFNVKLLV